MSQGYGLVLNLTGLGNVQFQNVSADHDTDELDSSSSLNSDGTFNDGFSDTDGDLSTLNVEIDTILKDARAISLMTFFVGGYQYPSTEYTLTYKGTVFVIGTGLYVRYNRVNFNIPGAARVRMAFKNLQFGYDIGGEGSDFP